MVQQECGGPIQCDSYLRFITRHFTVDRCKHATAFTTRNAEIHTNVCFQTHPIALQRCIHSQMDWIVAFACIIFVYDRTVIGDFMTSGPPTFVAKKKHIDKLQNDKIKSKPNVLNLPTMFSDELTLLFSSYTSSA